MRAGTSLNWMQWTVGLFLALGIGLLYIAQPRLLHQLDLNIHDAYLRLDNPGTPSTVPIIIDIDEASLVRYGQWPWPRYRLAALIDRLGQAGIAAVGLDILLAEKDRTSPVLLQEQLQHDFGLTVRFDGLPEQIADNDAILANVLRNNPAVLGCYFRFDNATDSTRSFPGPAIAESGQPGALPARTHLQQARSAVLPLPGFVASAPVAFFNVSPDQDGVVRRVPLVLGLGDGIQAGLALRTLMLATKRTTLMLQTDPDGLHAVRLGRMSIPVSPDGTMPVLFRGPSGTYPVFSAVDILDARIDPTQFKERIAFIGTSAAALRDIRATPFDTNFPGVETHAAVIDAILSQRFLTVPPWTPGAQILGIALTGILSVLLFGRARPLVYVPAGLLLAVALWFAGRHLFLQGTFFSPLYMLLTAGLESLGLVGLRFWQEERQKRHIHRAFSRYVSPEIVGRIVDSGRADALLAGEQRTISLLFSDIRGFTSLSEQLSPDQVVALLNQYFTPMTTIIRSGQGTLDKFIGDALMAFWNAPLDVPDHAQRCVEAAQAMQEALKTLNLSLQARHGLTLSIGIGLHTGPAFVGNMGTEELLAYTAIGDNVNLAARLEGLCPVYGVGILASGETRNLCPEVDWIRLDRVRVKGKARPVDLCTPLNPEEADQRADELLRFADARNLYAQGRFTQAATLFRHLHDETPHTTYALYIERCEKYAAAPPVDWDGVWMYTAK